MTAADILGQAIFFSTTITATWLLVRQAVKRNGGPTNGWLSIVRVWESIAILFGRPRPVVEGNEKLTLDEMGMTLWEASDAHYDADALNRIRKSHQLEHKLWLNFAGENHWTDEERQLVGLPKVRKLYVGDPVSIRNWNGDVIRTDPDDEVFEVEDLEDEATICSTHPKNQVCYYCDNKLPPLKRQKRRRK